MKMKYMGTVLLILPLLAGCMTNKEGKEKKNKETEAQLMSQARVSKAEAEKTALNSVPGGMIKEGELEKEHGKLIWSFDISTAGQSGVTEVQVDAITGAIISSVHESAAAEAKEKKSESKKVKKAEKEEAEKNDKK
jgi:PBP1b-binding outer membrane lipoprotein LpoB